MVTAEQLKQLADELDALRVVMKDQTAKIKQQDDLIKQHARDTMGDGRGFVLLTPPVMET
jgi:hypothetical protein